MMDVVVDVLIGLEILLISFLFFKAHSLYSENLLAVSEDQDLETRSGLSAAQDFAIDQLLNFQVEREIGAGRKADSINEAVSLFLIGGIQFIGEQSHCSKESMRALTAKVLKSELNLTPIDLGKFFSIASKDLPEQCYETLLRAGENAAKAWMDSHAVPQAVCLKSRVDNYLIAA